MESTWKTLIKFSLPMTFIGIAELLITFIDIIWVKYFINDINALAAIRISFTYTMLIEAIIIGFVSAMLIYISQSHSAGQKEDSAKALKTTISFIIILGILFGGIGLLFLNSLGSIFGVNEITVNYATNYLRPLLFGFALLILNNFFLILPRYFDNLKIVYYALAILIITSVIVTPVLMYFFERYNKDLMGAASLGTLIANIFCLAYLTWKIAYEDKLNINFSLKYFQPYISFNLIKRKFSFIFSQVFNNLTFNLSTFIYIILLSFYPAEAFNTYAVGGYLFLVFGVFSQNFSFSLLPLVSKLKGEGNLNEINRIIKSMVKVVVVYSLIVVIFLLIFRVQISGLLVDSGSVATFVKYIEIYSIPWLLGNISMIYILLSSSSGDARGSMYLIFSNMYVIVILTILMLPNLFNNVVIGVFYALALIQLLTLVNSYGLYLTGRWKKNYILDREE